MDFSLLGFIGRSYWQVIFLPWITPGPHCEVNEGFLCTFSLFGEGSVCVCRGHLCSPLKQGGFFILLHEPEIHLPCIYCHGRFKAGKKSGLRMHSSQQQGRSGVRSAHRHTFTHLGAVQYHRCHCDFIDRPLAPAAEVSLSARAPSEWNEKRER